MAGGVRVVDEAGASEVLVMVRKMLASLFCGFAFCGLAVALAVMGPDSGPELGAAERAERAAEHFPGTVAQCSRWAVVQPRDG